MSRIIKILNYKKFKKENLENWDKISQFWLNGQLSQKKDLTLFYKKKLEQFFKGKKKPLKILDVGCGDGWILDIIESIKGANYYYTGIDYNKNFIDYLTKYRANSHTKFIFYDIEKLNNTIDIEKFDLIINSFSLFEMPNYNRALENEVKMLEPNGSILVFSIDPITQLMAISSNELEFKENCKMYAKYKNKSYYRKHIDTGHGFANHEYLGILHSISDYFKVLKKTDDFKIYDLEEINMLDDIVPKIYQYVEFKI